MARFQIVSPHPYPERILFFGNGGSGKSTNVLNMARYMPYAHFWVNDTDVSTAYKRLLASEFTDVWEREQVTVIPTTDWIEFTEANKRITMEADQETDVLVCDNVTFPWQWVADQHVEAMYGIDYDTFLFNLRRQHKDDNKAYSKELSESMQWPIINKKFYKGLYQHYAKWRGHAIMVSMAKPVKNEKDEGNIEEFKVHGAMPEGQKALPGVMGTNILTLSRGHHKWAISTTKDRGRPTVERLDIDEFAIDYLVDVAKWDKERVRG